MPVEGRLSHEGAIMNPVTKLLRRSTPKARLGYFRGLDAAREKLYKGYLDIVPMAASKELLEQFMASIDEHRVAGRFSPAQHRKLKAMGKRTARNHEPT